MILTNVLNLVILSVVIECNICTCVQFYKYPIKIPANSVASRSGRASSVSSSAWVDNAVQFIVSNEKDGSYHFGYDTGGGSHSPTSYREEKRDPDGRIFGRYAYIDPDGILRITEYVADSQGFRSTESKRVLFDTDTSDLQLIGPIPKPANRGYPY